jgi:hypothetical protein
MTDVPHVSDSRPPANSACYGDVHNTNFDNAKLAVSFSYMILLYNNALSTPVSFS